MRYSNGFRQSILKRVLPPASQQLREVSQETGISEQTTFCGSEVFIGLPNVLSTIKANSSKGTADNVLKKPSLSRGNDKIFRQLLL